MSDETLPQLADGANRPIKRKVSITNAADARAVYANNSSITLSIWDILIDFGIIQRANRERLDVENHVRIIMSPPQAKVLSVLLARQVARYEQEYGPIASPVPIEEEADDPDTADEPAAAPTL
jgi:hypothetical protein